VTKPALVPELYVSDLVRSMLFYVDVLGFEVAYQRSEDKFAYLTLGNAHLMLEQADTGRKFLIAPLERPFGRGMNLDIEVGHVVSLYAGVTTDGAPIHLPMEEKWYRVGDELTGRRQFVVEDPDGYLLRFSQDLGRKPSNAP
jgi:catechol 2,3-dioxygenase-like lactoylglutathione lyase family enzyme